MSGLSIDTLFAGAEGLTRQMIDLMGKWATLTNVIDQYTDEGEELGTAIIETVRAKVFPKNDILYSQDVIAGYAIRVLIPESYLLDKLRLLEGITRMKLDGDSCEYTLLNWTIVHTGNTISHYNALFTFNRAGG